VRLDSDREQTNRVALATKGASGFTVIEIVGLGQPLRARGRDHPGSGSGGINQTKLQGGRGKGGLNGGR
jgi:hypothetical protein